MARGALAVGAALLALTLMPVVALVGQAGLNLRLSPGDVAAIRFTVIQAALSAMLSVAFAVPVARALARRRFPGRGLMIAALGAPFILPVIVAVMGLLAVFGRAGWLNAALATLDLPPVSIYGLHGVVLAHVFFNLPLAVRLILMGWQAIPAERFRLAQSLGFTPRDTFRHLEAPMLRTVLTGATLLIFTLCLTSFAVALTLGGGPRATTVELAIYQALRFDFDLAAAARLALVQFALCTAAFLVATRLTLPPMFGTGLDRTGGPEGPQGWRRTADAALLLTAALFIALPLAAIALKGLPGLTSLPPEVLPATLRSLTVALAATALTITAALTLSLAAARGARLPALAATLPLAASSLVLGTGLFLLLRPFAAPPTLALPVTIAVNTALALPFAFRALAPEAKALASHDRLAASLGLTGIARLRWLTLPRLARPLGFAAGLTAALAMGDLGVIALVAGEGQATLPLVIQRLMGAYRTEAAASAALLLVTLSFALFALFDGIGRRAAP